MAGIRGQLEKIDNLSLRERVILLVGGIIILFILWLNIFHDPLQKEKTATLVNIDKKTTEVESLSLQLQVLNERKQIDPNAENRDRRDQLLSDIESTRSEILQATSELVAPERMPELLRSILKRTEGLQLVKLTGLGRTPLIETVAEDEKDNGNVKDSEEQQEDQEMQSAYKHGMKIVFEGNFLTTVEYIKKLEELDWQFFWDSIDFKVEDYPRSVSSITLYTLSLDENWIGI